MIVSSCDYNEVLTNLIIYGVTIGLNSYWLLAVAEFCGNVELCRLTEQVVFSDPYKVSQYNRCTSPYLDRDAEAVREDNLLKLEVAELKSKYCGSLCFYPLYAVVSLLDFFFIGIYVPVGSLRGPRH